MESLAAVVFVFQLYGDSVWITEVNLGLVLADSWFDTEFFQPVRCNLNLKIIQADAEVIDAGWLIDGIQAEETVAEPQVHTGRLFGNDGYSQYRFIKRLRPRHVRDRERDMIQ